MNILTYKTWLAIAPTLGLAANVVAHLYATWFTRIHGLYPRLLFGAVCGLIATLAFTFYAGLLLPVPTVELIGYTAFNSFTFAVLSFGYFNFVQLNLSSLRVRIANELYESASGVPLSDLLKIYSADEIVSQRLARLSRGGQIIERDGRYYHRFSLVYLIAVSMNAAKVLVYNRRIRDGFRRAPKDNAHHVRSTTS